jgi:hypothetical protein
MLEKQLLFPEAIIGAVKIVTYTFADSRLGIHFSFLYERNEF